MEDEEMNLAELLKVTAEENQTRKILAIMAESKDLEEAKEKVKALLKKQGNITHNIREQKTKNISCQLLPHVLNINILAGK